MSGKVLRCCPSGIQLTALTALMERSGLGRRYFDREGHTMSGRGIDTSQRINFTGAEKTWSCVDLNDGDKDDPVLPFQVQLKAFRVLLAAFTMRF